MLAGNPRKTDNLTANVPTYFFSSEISHVATIAGTQHNDTALGALPFLFTDTEAASRCSHTVRAYGNPSSSSSTSRYGLELWNPWRAWRIFISLLYSLLLEQKASKPRIESSVAKGSVLKGINFLKDGSDPIAMDDHEYPDWLWDLLDEKKQKQKSSKPSNRQYHRKQNRDAIKAQNFMKDKKT